MATFTFTATDDNAGVLSAQRWRNVGAGWVADGAPFTVARGVSNEIVIDPPLDGSLGDGAQYYWRITNASTGFEADTDIVTHTVYPIITPSEGGTGLIVLTAVGAMTKQVDRLAATAGVVVGSSANRMVRGLPLASTSSTITIGSSGEIGTSVIIYSTTTLLEVGASGTVTRGRDLTATAAPIVVGASGAVMYANRTLLDSFAGAAWYDAKSILRLGTFGLAGSWYDARSIQPLDALARANAWYDARDIIASLSATSTIVLSASGTILLAPGQVSGLSAVANGPGRIDLSWLVPYDGGSAITGYEWRRSIDGGGTWPDTGSVGAVPAATQNGLTNGQEYTYQVAATNAVGTGAWSASASATPVDVPDAPTGLVVTPGDEFLGVAFTAPADDNGSAITGYLVEWRLQPGFPWSQVGVASSPTQISLIGQNGQTFDVRVAAVNAVGTGPWSPIVAGTPVGPPEAIAGLTATEV